MQINNPTVIAELTSLHERYEKALMDNDVSTLDELFWDSPHAIRYGVTENLHGSQEIRAFRQRRPKVNLERELLRLQITAFGDSIGIVNLEFIRLMDNVKRSGRQTQFWLRLVGRWKIVSAHVSLLPRPVSYVDVAAEKIGLPIAPADRGGVEEEFRRISAIAEGLLAFELDQNIQAAPVFQP